MSMTMERSKFHELVQRCQEDDRINVQFKDYEVVLAAMDAAPKFVFTHDVMDFIDGNYEDYAAALRAAIAAGHTALPHDPMLIEYDNHPSATGNRNYWLVVQSGVSSYKLFSAMRDPRMVMVCDGYFHIDFYADGHYAIHDYEGVIPVGAEHFFNKLYKDQAYVALFYAMALHVRGVVTKPAQPVDPKLARARVKRRQPPITRDYVTVHIGYVTDRDGKRHEFKEGVGGHVRVHLRRGHVRNQVCGPNNSEHKEIWIPSTLVNYRPGVQVSGETNYLVVP